MHPVNRPLSGYLRLRPPRPEHRPTLHQPAPGCLLIVSISPQPEPRHVLRIIGRLIIRPRALAGPMPYAALPSRANLGEPPALPASIQPRPAGLAYRPDLTGAPPGLRPVQNGRTYRITSPPENGLVTPDLAQTLEKAFESLGSYYGYTQENQLGIAFRRGYDQGDRGHGAGLAADIAAVGGRPLREWKQDLDQAIAHSQTLTDPAERRAAIAASTTRNLGLQLYRVLLQQGGWRVYHHVTQLFGPWTAELGPWKKLNFDQPGDAQRRLMSEQEHIYQAHQDHIHVAAG